jgi:hypothetical protein
LVGLWWQARGAEEEEGTGVEEEEGTEGTEGAEEAEEVERSEGVEEQGVEAPVEGG